MGPSLLVSSKYYIWIRLPQILAHVWLSCAENPAMTRVRRFPVMTRIHVMYGRGDFLLVLES